MSHVCFLQRYSKGDVIRLTLRGNHRCQDCGADFVLEEPWVVDVRVQGHILVDGVKQDAFNPIGPQRCKVCGAPVNTIFSPCDDTIGSTELFEDVEVYVGSENRLRRWLRDTFARWK